MFIISLMELGLEMAKLAALEIHVPIIEAPFLNPFYRNINPNLHILEGGAMPVEIRMTLIGKNMVRIKDTWAIRLDFAEERPAPPVMTPRDSIVGEIMPIIERTIQALSPITSAQMMPRMTLWLTDDEWDSLDRKHEVGEKVTVIITDENKIIIK